MATIREESRANVESTEGVFIPRLTNERGNMSVTQLASRKDRMGTEVTGLADKAMVSRCGRVKVGWFQVVESKLNERQETAPKV
jgi:hypothetical protein